MATEVLYLVKEKALGVPVSSPTLGTDAFYIKLSQPNAFSMRSNPTIGELPRGNGDGTTSCFYTAQSVCTGGLAGELYPTLAKVLMDWALTPVATGRAAPWATNSSGPGTFAIGDLASVSLYHAVLNEWSGVWKRKRYSGVKVLGGSLAASDSDVVVKYDFQLQGVRSDTNAAGTVADPDADEFPLPGDDDYPCGPYTYPDLGVGGLKIGSARADYGSVNFTWKSTINPQFFEGKYVRSLKYKGRGAGTTLVVNLAYKDTPDDEAAYQALAKQDAELTLDGGAGALKIDLNGNNVWSQRTHDLGFDGPYMWQGTLRNGYDATAGGDLSVTFTPVTPPEE